MWRGCDAPHMYTLGATVGQRRFSLAVFCGCFFLCFGFTDTRSLARSLPRVAARACVWVCGCVGVRKMNRHKTHKTVSHTQDVRQRIHSQKEGHRGVGIVMYVTTLRHATQRRREGNKKSHASVLVGYTYIAHCGHTCDTIAHHRYDNMPRSSTPFLAAVQSVRVYIHTYMHIYIYVCMHACMHACACACVEWVGVASAEYSDICVYTRHIFIYIYFFLL